MPDLNPFEQAVVDVLEGDSACTWHVGCDVEDCHEPRARAIAKAVLEAAADRMLQHSQDAKDHDATEDSVYTFMVAADRLRAWAGGEDRG